MLYFTSDTHFLQKSIITHCNRPFKDVFEMNEVLIDNWNSVISPNDTVYHLGDFSLSKVNSVCANDLLKIFKRLNGHKNLIEGNHDYKKVKKLPWASVKSYDKLKIGNKFIVLFHYPILSWDRKSYGSIMLHGHGHGELNADIPNLLDVGTDCHNYTPISLDQVFIVYRGILRNVVI